jgi:D-alanyl-D-alanine carboxypeptidase/D-alanyl-D-alanine-endopeptidase (penicillin-binding protein 4)
MTRRATFVNAGRYCLIAALAAAPIASIAAQSGESLEARIQKVVDRPEFKHAFFGLAFYSLETGKPIYRMNADKLFVPGSTTKLLTEGTALSLLGADFKFHTKAYHTGTLGKDGTLNGDVILVASGDPNLSGRLKADGTLAFENEDHSYDGDPSTRAVPGDPLLAIKAIAKQISSHGVKRVMGRVIVDATLFESGDRELGTGVVISPITINDNLIDLMIGPGASQGAAATLSQSTVTSYARFINKVTTGAAGSRAQVRFSVDDAKGDGTHTVTVSGSLPLGRPVVLYSYAVPDPARFGEVVLTEALRAEGVTVRDFSSTKSPDFKSLASSYVADRVIAEYVSAPFHEEVKVTLKVSQNLHASMTPRMIRAILAPTDTAKTGFDLENAFLAKAGLDLTGAQQSDGAGGDAHFTPDFMVSYLTYMAHQKDSAYFYNALPILGRDGTLWNIQSSTPAAGHIHAKTGTFNVYDELNRKMFVTGKGMAGYMTTAKGENLVFAVYVNNVAVGLEPNAVTAVTGQALGEIAAAVYEGP